MKKIIFTLLATTAITVSLQAQNDSLTGDWYGMDGAVILHLYPEGGFSFDFAAIDPVEANLAMSGKWRQRADSLIMTLNFEKEPMGFKYRVRNDTLLLHDHTEDDMLVMYRYIGQETSVNMDSVKKFITTNKKFIYSDKSTPSKIELTFNDSTVYNGPTLLSSWRLVAFDKFVFLVMDHDDYDFTTYRIHRIQNGIMDMTIYGGDDETMDYIESSPAQLKVRK